MLHGLVIEGHLEHHTLSNLRWLYWDGFSSKTISLNLPNLVVLEITSSEIRELWSHIQVQYTSQFYCSSLIWLFSYKYLDTCIFSFSIDGKLESANSQMVP